MSIAQRVTTALILLIVVSLAIPVLAANFTLKEGMQPSEYQPPQSEEISKSTRDIEAYAGNMRVYIMEPTSRWKDDSGHPYENAHIWFPLITPINIPDGMTRDTTVSWNGTAAGFGNVTSENIGAVAALFNGTPQAADSYPPNGWWYTAYYADASATAFPTRPGQNMTATGFTHSVFVEEGTAVF